MGIDEVLKGKREEILRLAAKRGVCNVRVFGSFARGDARPDSDVDFLVSLQSGRTLLDAGGLLMDLQQLLGRSVHVVTDKSLHQFIRERVMAEARPV